MKKILFKWVQIQNKVKPSFQNLFCHDTDGRKSGKLKLVMALFVGVALVDPARSAPDSSETLGGISISARGGTLGIGLELTKAITKKLNVKAVINGLSISDEAEVDDIDYDFDFDLFTAGALLDWHPFNGSFRLSGGLLYSGSELDVDATTNDEFDIGDRTYTSEEIGTLNGNVDFNDFAPYFGIGWGNPFGKDNRWEILFDIGLLYIGSADADLSSSGGTFSNNPILISDLKEEEEELEDDIEDFAFYPVFSIGVSYKF